jgi:hypothetical protein
LAERYVSATVSFCRELGPVLVRAGLGY